MRSKTIIAIAATVLLVFSFALAVSAATPSVSLSAAEAKPGESVTIDVMLSDNEAFAALHLAISYDSDVLTPTAITSLIKPAPMFTPSPLENNPVMMIWLKLSEVTANGKIGEITFKVADDAEADSYVVAVSVIDAYRKDSSKISVTKQNTTVTVLAKEGAAETTPPEQSGGSTPKPGPSSSAHTHKYTATVVLPTEAEYGYTLYTCDVCGKSYKDDYVAYKEAATDEKEGEVKVDDDNKVDAGGEKEVAYYMDANGNKVYIGFYFVADGVVGSIAPDGVELKYETNDVSFADANAHWAKEYISFVTSRTLFNGTSASAFSPEATMTRAMFATVIGRLYERSFGIIPDVDGTVFGDVEKGSYYEKYVAWANENKIITGMSADKFAPNSNITRAQMAAILFRFGTFIDGVPVSEQTTLNYSDASSIASWATDAALYCQSTGIITGRAGGKFAPDETATRAEGATILTRFIKSVLENVSVEAK